MTDDEIIEIAAGYSEQDNSSTVSFYPSNLLKFARAIEAARATAEQRDGVIDAVPGVVHIQELMLKWINVNSGPNATVVWNEIEAALHSLATTAHRNGYTAGVKDLREFSTLINREKL